MPLLDLPHTRGCLVCGRENPYGLSLHLHVDDSSGVVSCDFTPEIRHIGFEGIVHGGLSATVLDEAMVWAATWALKRFCVCGELNVRFRQPVVLGQTVQVRASVASVRSRLIETEASLRDPAGKVLVEAEGKYVPVSAERNRDVLGTLVAEPKAQPALRLLQAAGGAV